MDVESTKADEEARKRRERLKNLRNRISENQNGEDENVDEALPKPVFRNYTPLDEDLRLNQLPKPKPESGERLKSNEDDLAEAVNIQAEMANKDVDSDED
ncbi:unnamed protein product [Larinioides sclopetarius]|uniref:Uncharacterized protein n=1 Tax=Larinioides sclopetarius TaxID=280406 RepID=A0AAV2AMD7_9ARAC